MMEELDTIFMMLDPGTIDRLVNRPIDAALEEFTYDEPKPMTHAGFNRIISQFVLTLPDSTGNQEDALTEAIWILENTYRGEKTLGYDGAFFDACDPSVGMDAVLYQLVQGIKIVKQKAYVSSIIARYIDPLDWDQRVEIAEKIMVMSGNHISESTRNSAPARRAHYLSEYFQTYIQAESEIRSMVTETV